MNVALIPARGGSKRIPNKNLKELDGRPLLVWTITTAQACSDIDEVVVSTDSLEIGDVAARYGATVLNRPSELAGDNVQDYPVIKHYHDTIGDIAKLIVYLRPTTPIRNTEVVNNAINVVKDSISTVSGLRSAHRMKQSAFKCFYKNFGFATPIKYMAEDLSDYPDQTVEPTYSPNGYVDIVIPDTLKRGSAWGDLIVLYETKPVIELDVPEDWDYLEYWLKVESGGGHEFYRGRPFGII